MRVLRQRAHVDAAAAHRCEREPGAHQDSANQVLMRLQTDVAADRVAKQMLFGTPSGDFASSAA